MARGFDGSTSIFTNTSYLTYPFLVASRARLNALVSGRAIWSSGDKDADNDYMVLFIVSDGTVRFRITQPAGADIDASTTIGAGVYHQFLVWAVSPTERWLWLDGGSRGGSASEPARELDTPDQFRIGEFARLSTGGGMDGRIAEVFAWQGGDLASGFDETSMGKVAVWMAAGGSPWKFRPDLRVVASPLWRDEDTNFADQTKYTMDGAGATVENHPPVAPLTLSMFRPSMPLIEAAAFVPFPHPRGLRAGMGELVGGMS